MKYVFDEAAFRFPYRDLKFPGQASDERILYVTREAPVMLQLRLAGLAAAVLMLLLGALWLPKYLTMFGQMTVALAEFLGLLIAALFLSVGGWWLWSLWRKSVFILTNRRLTKFIYTTPWNRYHLSLNLDKIEDTGAYARGYFQALTGVGTFTARSGAGNRADKYFFIDNVHAYEDLANYVNKLLFHFERNMEKLDSFRPFIPHLKGKRRESFMKDYPEFWS